MKFRTPIDIVPLAEKIDYSSSIFMIGSCFAQNIGTAMSRAKFDVVSNPTGTLFNPLSICKSIERIAAQRPICESELRQGSSGWYHYDFHSSLRGDSVSDALECINGTIRESGEALKRADWVVITLGTAYIYELASSGEVVANCHKEPARNFTRRMVSVPQIVEALVGLIERELSGKRVIITLSPIRHISDGLAENSLSKATLRVAIDEVVQHFVDRVHYFPAYEIVMDDLRDYRFYSDDMVHPSAVAIDYIWEHFILAALSDEARALLPRVMRIVKAAEHRPSDATSEGYAAHCRAQLKAIEALPQVDFTKEQNIFTPTTKK